MPQLIKKRESLSCQGQVAPHRWNPAVGHFIFLQHTSCFVSQVLSQNVEPKKTIPRVFIAWSAPKKYDQVRNPWDLHPKNPKFSPGIPHSSPTISIQDLRWLPTTPLSTWCLGHREGWRWGWLNGKPVIQWDWFKGNPTGKHDFLPSLQRVYGKVSVQPIHWQIWPTNTWWIKHYCRMSYSLLCSFVMTSLGWSECLVGCFQISVFALGGCSKILKNPGTFACDTFLRPPRPYGTGDFWERTASQLAVFSCCFLRCPVGKTSKIQTIWDCKHPIIGRPILLSVWVCLNIKSIFSNQE